MNPQNWSQILPRTVVGSLHTDSDVLRSTPTMRTSETDHDPLNGPYKFAQNICLMGLNRSPLVNVFSFGIPNPCHRGPSLVGRDFWGLPGSEPEV